MGGFPVPGDAFVPVGRRGGGRPRVALYSHDTQGLGHMRRNLALAEALSQAHGCTVLLITGAREAGVFAMPDGADCLALPSVDKSLDGRYRPRSIGLPLDEVLRVRADTIHAAIAAFGPDVLIADKVPTGLGGELEPTLEDLAERDCRLVLGLRDVLDAPDVVRDEWERSGCVGAIRRWYDAIWVYGDPRVYDPVVEYGLAGDVAERIRYTGYIDRRAAEAGASPGAEIPAELDLPPGPLALCLVGGGQDGHPLADAFLSAATATATSALIVTGPFMPIECRRRLKRRAAGSGSVQVVEFAHGLDAILERAERVVAMGGYNSVCELVARGKRALIVPRVRPRREQLIRAERMRDLGLVDMLHPGRLTPYALARWLTAPPARPRPPASLDVDGLARIPALLAELLTSPAGEVARAG